MIVRADLDQQPGRAGVRRPASGVNSLTTGVGSKSGLSKDSRPLASNRKRCSSVMHALMAIPGCTGRITRNRRQLGAAQQSGGKPGREDASAMGAPPLTARKPWYGEGNSKSALPSQLSAGRRGAQACSGRWRRGQSQMAATRPEARGVAREPNAGTPGRSLNLP